MDGVTTAKVISTFIIFIITLVFCSLPAFLLRCLQGRGTESRTQTVISYLNCFAGGVFLGTALLHLFAESGEEVREAFDNIDYPISELTVGGGFFLILISEVIATKVLSRVRPKIHHEASNNSKYGTVASEQKHVADTDNANETTLSELGKVIKHGKTEKVITTSGAHAHDDVIIALKEKPTILRGTMLVLALSLHMIFESLAVGLQKESFDVWTLILAISLHKCIVAFSVGLQIRQILASWKFVLFIICFSIISTVGIPIGIALSDEQSSGVTGLLQCVATGTFIYVTFFEILNKELSHNHNIAKLFLCFLGFAGIAALKLLDKD